ncbi:response regulator transcription factor [Clostridium sp.]|uniref:response regulator transcription factor n=1 Tax=Clostridium sp. TaxID=1506 RepID=UPI003F2D146A
MNKILVVEDEISINDILTTSLIREGYNVESAFTGEEALRLEKSFKPDLVLLDLMLPDINGEDIIKDIRNNCYVIMVTAKDTITDKLKGMEEGADDYITKPFDIREVKMRIKAILRREEKLTRGIRDNTNNSLVINELERIVLKNNVPIKLNKKEFDLLAYFNKNKGIILSRDKLLDNVWGFDYFGDDRTVDVHIRRLRSKLGEDSDNSIIETVFGVGYIMR